MGCAESKDKVIVPTLKAGEQLKKGQSIVSANGQFNFILQEDGNAVVYRGERALWGSNTHGRTVTHLNLAADGVFIKNVTETVWSTEPAGCAADQLTIKDDGNLVLLDKDGNTKWESKSTFDDGQFDLRTRSAVVAAKAPLGVAVEAGKTYYWCTCGKSKNQPFCDGSHQSTDFKPLAWTAPESKDVFICACKQTKNAPFCDGSHRALPPDTMNRSTTDTLFPGGAGLTSKNGRFRVVLQTDGNVVLYEGPDNLPENARWATGTTGNENTWFTMQSDGNVVLYGNAGQALWASNTGSSNSAATRLVVTDDGKLVLFGEQHLWSS